LDIGEVQIVLARHFGFCYGVENAIEISFRAVQENPDKRIFLLGEMIHNPGVNADLINMGVRFLMDTSGKMLFDWDELKSDDIVIIPAFGTTLELEEKLRQKGIEPSTYETTCPFVEKVWNRAEKIGKDGYTIIVHGKPKHEETRATFSHSRKHTPTVVVKDMTETTLLAKYIKNELPKEQFYTDFAGQFSEGFDIEQDLQRIGVVNQTTMLASETQGIADYLRQVMVDYYTLSADQVSLRFSDTRDTLCYATNDNQSAVQGLLQDKADFALVIGGYNSSNTSHLVELCEQQLPTYFINHEDCLISASEIQHYDLHTHNVLTSHDYIPSHRPLSVMVTSGASCPDALVERVIQKLSTIVNKNDVFEQVVDQWQSF
jgi:4-hydroxy-3-methylbut-2-enyl diphosphate reductase